MILEGWCCLVSKFYQHLKTITIHKWKVGKLCFKCGLYKQGLLHDCSKYSWIEFSAGVRYFQGNRSPIDKEKEVLGVSYGWLHHKGRNKHHWEYWIDHTPNGMGGLKMPVHYVVEMFCDRVVASMIYYKENYTNRTALDYFERGEGEYIMHEETKALLREMLEYLANTDDLENTVKMIRKDILKK